MRITKKVYPKLHSIGPKIPYRRSSGRKKGEDHPRYVEVIRWLRKYNGTNHFVISVKAQDLKGWDLSKPQVEALIKIMERV